MRWNSSIDLRVPRPCCSAARLVSRDWRDGRGSVDHLRRRDRSLLLRHHGIVLLLFGWGRCFGRRFFGGRLRVLRGQRRWRRVSALFLGLAHGDELRFKLLLLGVA